MAKRKGSASTEKKGVRLVGYIRVSTEEQKRGGLSVEGQEQQLRNYATMNGHEIITILKDEGLSGKKSVSKRPGASAAMAMVEKKQADGVIIWKLDRLGRDANELTLLAKKFHRKGWELLSATENLDSTNFMGRFFIHLLAGLAEMESGRTGERVEMGMEQLVIKQRVRSFNTPFGWRMPDGRPRPKRRERSKVDKRKIGEPDSREMVESPEEQVILARILKLRAQGLGAYRVAKTLNEKGILNPRTKGTWWPNTIASICETVKNRDRILEEAS